VQLSTTLLAVLSQALLPRVDTDGMVAAYEFMQVTPAIANLIRENKTFRIDSAIQTGKKFGMQLLDEHLLSLYNEGKIADTEAIEGRLKIGRSSGCVGNCDAYRHSHDQARFLQHLRPVFLSLEFLWAGSR